MMAGKEFRIFKYPLEIIDSQDIELPIGAKYISMISQNNQPTIYAVVDSLEMKNEKWHFEIRGTGHWIDEGTIRFAQFLGTVITHEGALVWHVWRT